MALAPPLWFDCDSKNMFLGQIEQQQEPYQALTSGYWYPWLKLETHPPAHTPTSENIPQHRNRAHLPTAFNPQRCF